MHPCRTAVVCLIIALTIAQCRTTSGYEEADPMPDISDAEYLATREFAGPHGVPPEDIAAYGIVAFRWTTMRGSPDYDRHVWVCEAFVSALQSANAVAEERPQAVQMVTFWPVNSDDLASELNQAQPPSCEAAVGGYHLGSGEQAIKEAEKRGENLGTGPGPFLLAWAPPRMKGQADALILVMDLSTFNSQISLKETFERWQQKIERNPELWNNGWSVESVRIQIREFADYCGIHLFKLLAGG
jgi:hypothetical protein